MESETLDIKSILEDLGYKLQDSGPDFWMTKSLDRGNNKGQNLSISKKTGMVLDFSGGSKYSIEEFIKLNNGNFNIDSAQLENFRNISYNEELKLPKIFDKTILDGLIPDYSYWVEKRGISAETCKLFGGGIATETTPKLIGRFVTPIFNSGGLLEGFSARYLGSNKNISKQKLIGTKKNWVYPLHLSKDSIIESKTVILVEGLADLLSCYECGIKNVLCMFGIKLFPKMLTTLISLSVNKLIICTNWDENGVGQRAATEIKNQLCSFWDSDNIEIRLPKLNDLNEMLIKLGQQSVKGLLTCVG